MNRRRVVLAGIVLSSLALLPLAIALYFVVHLKGSPVTAWLGIDLGSLEPGTLLTRLAEELRNLNPDSLLSGLGIDPCSLDSDRVLHSLADLPGRTQEAGQGGAVGGASGIGGAGSSPFPWGRDPFTEGIRKKLPQSAQDVGDRVIHERRTGQGAEQ
ncbi:MAG: hypothetical protein JXM73_25580 [Anaerolineae bacterium]|nr:hypothetical protein [Anaerolineae bacterium]